MTPPELHSSAPLYKCKIGARRGELSNWLAVAQGVVQQRMGRRWHDLPKMLVLEAKIASKDQRAPAFGS